MRIGDKALIKHYINNSRRVTYEVIHITDVQTIQYILSLDYSRVIAIRSNDETFGKLEKLVN